MPTCRRCGINLVWAKPYVKGSRPVNEDGTSHDCGADPKKRFVSDKFGNFQYPKHAYIGVDRCEACKYNFHKWCDRGKTKPCLANV